MLILAFCFTTFQSGLFSAVSATFLAMMQPNLNADPQLPHEKRSLNRRMLLGQAVFHHLNQIPVSEGVRQHLRDVPDHLQIGEEEKTPPLLAVSQHRINTHHSRLGLPSQDPFKQPLKVLWNRRGLLSIPQ